METKDLCWMGLVLTLFIGGISIGENSPRKAHAAEPKKNSATKQCSVPVTSKPDPCRPFHDGALKAIENVKTVRWSSGIIQNTTLSTAFSLLYQNCRDLERRESK